MNAEFKSYIHKPPCVLSCDEEVPVRQQTLYNAMRIHFNGLHLKNIILSLVL